MKTAILSGALALCTTLFGCTSAPSEQAAQGAITATSRPASGNVCDQFCQSQGGPHYLIDFATSEAQCTQKGGDWYTADQDYEGPPPGCCCKCAEPGVCL